MSNPFSFSFASLPVINLNPDPAQPRRKRNPQADKELRESMRLNGMCQTIMVREEDGKFIIVNGERRWNAASELGWENVDCLITTADSQHTLLLQLIENVQREDLCPEDLAAHLNALMSQHQAEDRKATMRVLATLTGKSAGWVSEKLALAHLPAEVRALKDNNTVKNSRVLIGLSRLNESNPEAASTLIKEIEGGKDVTIELINQVRGSQRKKRAPVREKVEMADLPSPVLRQPAEQHESETGAPSSLATTGVEENTQRPSGTEKSKPAKRKKRVTEVAKLIGVSDDLPAEEFLEALAEAYAKLLAEREAVTA